jgi:DNA-binding LacI/PurR family transcriptional regulator
MIYYDRERGLSHILPANILSDHMARPKSDISIFRIAEEGGVSISTVSRVINNRTGVNEETRARILELLKKYEFSPDYPRQRAPKIAFFSTQDDINEYFQRAIRGISRYTCDHAMEVGIVVRSTHRGTTLLQQLRDLQCAGVVAVLAEHLQGELDQFGASGIPVIFLDGPLAIPNTGFIDHDAYGGSCLAARHLLSLGHEKIGYIIYPDASINQIQRFKGYENTMNEAGIAVKPQWIGRYPSRTAGSPPLSKGVAGFEMMNLLLKQAPELTAVMAVDDEMAFGAMTAIHRAGLHIPKDISIVGFDNNIGTELYPTALTTVEHPIEEASYLAAKAIDEAIRNPGAWNLPKEILPTRLVRRDSTGPAPKAPKRH